MPDQDAPASGAPSSAAEMAGRPAPDDPRKPRSPFDLKGVDWRFTFKATLREFGEDQLTDLAAALTYYAVLSVFPALIAVVAILTILGQGGSAITDLIAQLQAMGVLPASAVASLQPVLDMLTTAPAPGVGVVIGLLAAVWSASNYVKAFGRAMNRIYEVQEGRPALRLNLEMYALTGVLLLMLGLMLVLITVSGPVADAVARLLGVTQLVAVWNYGKLPLIAALVVFVVALLYHFTPNVRQPRLRWLSVGAIVAIAVAALASVGFGLYLAVQGDNSYTKTYGAFAGVIVFLFWLWIMNVALLFGGELDAELERARQLRGGLVAEEKIQLPPRDVRQSVKAEEAGRRQLQEAKRIRLSSGRGPGVNGGLPGPVFTDTAAERVRKAKADATRAEREAREAASEAPTATAGPPPTSDPPPARRTGVFGWLDARVRRRRDDRG